MHIIFHISEIVLNVPLLIRYILHRGLKMMLIILLLALEMLQHSHHMVVAKLLIQIDFGLNWSNSKLSGQG